MLKLVVALLLAQLALLSGCASTHARPEVRVPDRAAHVVVVSACGVPILALVSDGEVAAVAPPEQFNQAGARHGLLLRALEAAPDDQQVGVDIAGALEIRAGMRCPKGA